MKENLVIQLNSLLADVSVMYFKAHNLHWNVIGRQFVTIHTYLEEFYNELAGTIDEVAELMKKFDVYPKASMKEYLKVSSIVELESKDVSVTEVLTILEEDINILKNNALKVRVIAAEDDLFEVINTMEDMIESYSKTLWFIKSMNKSN